MILRRHAYLATAFCSLAIVAGCGGPSFLPVTGVVTLDGAPVEGATVTFTADDGSKTYSGSTDAAGKFTLQAGEKLGAPAGNYKVVVIRSAHKPTAEAPDPSAGMKTMKKDAEEVNKSSKGGTMAKMMGKGGPGAGSGVPSSQKNELPEIYGSLLTTTLTAKVPSESIKLEMKSKP